MFWEMVGYKTICILTNDFNHQINNGVLEYIFQHLSSQTNTVIHIVGEIAGFKSSTLAQVVRLVAAALPIDDDSYILTGDADMLPFSSSYFNQQDFGGACFHVFSSDVYGPPADRHFQMCYLGGDKKAWKSLMGIGVDNITNELSVLLRDRQDSWFVDECILAEKMKSWSLFDSCQLFPRGYPPGGYAPRRLDRGSWHLPFDLSSLIDCHSARPLLAHWNVLERLVDYFLPAESRDLAKSYVTGLSRFQT
jgi:hypothetical protein